MKIEYKIIYSDNEFGLEDALNGLGADGWEVAGVIPDPSSSAPSAVVILMRPMLAEIERQGE